MALRPPRQRMRSVIAGTALAIALVSQPCAGAADVVARAPDAFTTWGERQDGSGGAQPDLVGLLLDDRDLPVALSLIPAAPGSPDQAGIEALLRGLGLQPVHLADGGWQAETPLGTARLPPTEVRTRDGIDYAGLPALSRALGIGLRFDATAAAIVATTNWSLAARPETPPPSAEVIRPDASALAPTTSLSYWRTEAYFSHGDGNDSAYGSSDVGGGLAGGFWRARYEDDLADDRRLLDYTWVRTAGNRRWLLGHQQINSHPLLGSIELTGAQMAWTNLPALMYAGNLEEGELVSGRTAPASNIVGTGPVGGVAELRFDGIVVARVPVALDGRYEFRDIPLTHGASTRVEVALYENGSLGVPVRVEDHSGQASDQLLPQGAVLHYFGAGRHGNPLDPDERREGGAAFYEARYGALPGLTLDLIGQHVDGRDTWLTGGVFSLGVAGVYSAHVARSGERQAWQFDGEGFRGNAYWRLLARDEDIGFRGGTDSTAPGSLYERHVEAGWRGEHWALSLVGRDLDVLGASQPVRYLKPGVDWFPTQSLYFSARPDLSGRYQYSANWAMTRRLRAGAYLSFESDRYELEYQLSERWRSLAGRTEFLGRTRHSLLFTRDRREPGDIGLSLAALESEGDFGYLAAADARLFPGVTLRLQASDDPLAPGRGPVLQLGLVADFAVTPHGLSASQFRRSLADVGGIAGTLQLPGDADADFAAADTTVWIDGRRGATFDANGRFHVGELEPGVHRVRVDEGALPIEMRLTENEVWAEVRAGVVTAVEFPLELRLGFAGRVLTTAGEPAPSLALRVEDETGEVVGEAKTDSWGYYRVDGLAPGRYRLRAAESTALQERWIELTGEFLFGVDLRMEPAAP